ERVHRNRFVANASIFALGRDISFQVLQRAYHHLRGYEKARGYFLWDNIAYLTHVYRDTRRMRQPGLCTLEDLSNKLFVFFPLHTEPEASVGQVSPEFFFQHAAIAALSRDLPANVLLAVKETIHGVGRRPADFYRQIADLKNVVWINMMEY